MLRSLLLALERRRWLLASAALVCVGLWLPLPPGLPEAGRRVLVIAAGAMVLYLTEPVPLPTVALLIVVGQVLLGIAGPDAVARSFMSDSVFFIMGSLMMGAALARQNLDRRLALALFPLTGPSLPRLVAVLVAASALMASFVGEHTVAAILLPVVVALRNACGAELGEVRLLGALFALAVARGASVAMVGTPSGGARNAVMLEYWSSLYQLSVSYGQWMVWAYPLVLLQVPLVILVLLWRMRPAVADLRPAFLRLRQQVASAGSVGAREWGAVALFGGTVVLWVTSSATLGLGTIALLGAAAFLLTGLVSWEDYNEGVNWGVVLTYAANISLGVAMGRTGAATWLAGGILEAASGLGGGGPLVAMALIPVLGALVANAMGSGAMVAVFGPVALSLAEGSGGGIVAGGLLTVAASTLAYLTVVGTPASLILHAGGLVQPRDYWRTGWPLLLLSLAAMGLVASLYWMRLEGVP